MKRTLIGPIALACLLMACNGNSGESATLSTEGDGKTEGNSETSGIPTIVVNKDGASVQGTIFAGGSLLIQYSPTRLDPIAAGDQIFCRYTVDNQQPDSEVTARVEDNGDGNLKDLAFLITEVPHGSKLQIRFVKPNPWGGIVDEGFDVFNIVTPDIPLATLRFNEPNSDSSWNPQYSAKPYGGGKAKIIYRWERVYDETDQPHCHFNDGQHGDQWSILGYYKDTQEEVQSFPLTTIKEGKTIGIISIIDVPCRENLEMWFVNRDSSGCEQWDSNSGLNYHIPIQSSDICQLNNSSDGH